MDRVPLPSSDANNFIGRKPNRTITVPLDLRRDSTRAELDRLIARWKAEYGCTVRVLGFPGPVTGFEIYGSSGADKAQQEINEWIRRGKTKSKYAAAWARLPAYDDWKWSEDQLRERESQRKQMFKEEAPGDLPFSKTIDWPDELRQNQPSILPKDVFGLKLEALDDIRLGEEVYIAYCKTRQWAIQVQGHDPTRVDAAVDRCRKLIQKIYDHEFNMKDPLNLLLDQDEGSEVVLQEAPKWWPQRHHRIVPHLRHHSSTSLIKPGNFRSDAPNSAKVILIQKSLKLFIESIKYAKGYYDFNIRYGVFVLQSSKTMRPESEIGKTYPIDNLKDHIERTNACETNKWLLNEKQGNNLLTRMMAANDFLEQTRSTGFTGYTSSAANIRPLLRATYIFEDDQRNVIIVQIEWTDDDDEGGTYEKMEPRYFKLKPNTCAPSENIDIKLIELNDAKAWQFSLVSMMPLNKKLVSPAVTSFAANVHIQPNEEPPIRQRHPDPSLTTKGGRVEKIYTFNIKESGYRVDLVGRWYYQNRGVTPCCWGLDVRHVDWETHLSQMERLESGKCAQWGDVLATFFPDDGFTAPPPIEDQSPAVDDSLANRPREGVRFLLEILMKLSRFVHTSE